MDSIYCQRKEFTSRQSGLKTTFLFSEGGAHTLQVNFVLAEDDLNLLILLPLPAQGWDYTHASKCLGLWVMELTLFELWVD